MPSKSKSQQRFFGLVRKCQKTGECLSPKIKKVADNINKKDAKDFAKTKHKGLPNKRKRKTFKEYLEVEHPEFNYEENIIGAVIAMARAAKNKGRNRVSYTQEDGEISENNKYHVWTNKEGTEQKKGLFVKREGDFVYIELKDGIKDKLSINWLSERDLKYVDVMEDLNKKLGELNLLKTQIDATNDRIAKDRLLTRYKQIEIAHKQVEAKLKSFDN
jgi:hypothetical protein